MTGAFKAILRLEVSKIQTNVVHVLQKRIRTVLATDRNLSCCLCLQLLLPPEWDE